MKSNSKEPLVLSAQNFSAIPMKKRMSIPLVTNQIKNSDVLLGIIGLGIILCLLSLSLLLVLDNSKVEVQPMPVINEMIKTYTVEEDSIDMFAKWQAKQKNILAQREWDAYMGEEDGTNN